jgi:hypothetical protein
MTRATLAAGCALGTLFTAGCGAANRVVSLAEPTRAPPASEYVDQVKKWTRHAHLREDFDIALDIDATLRSPEFRAAYAEKFIRVYRVGPALADQKRIELRTDGANTYELHIETQTHTYELNDLVPNKKIWRLGLLNDRNQEVQALEIQSLKDRPEVAAAFYPYAGLFSRGWRVRFPTVLADGTPLVGPDTASLTLRISGPQGSVDLVWRLR